MPSSATVVLTDLEWVMLSGKIHAILAIAAVFTMSFSNVALGAPQLLAPEAACQLGKSDEVPSDVSYSIRGIYNSDGYHFTELEVPACDRIIWPKIDGEASTRIAEYHYAFTKECGSILMGDYISGVFTGNFVKSRIQTRWGPMMMNIFIISDIDSKNLDVTSITCPK